MSDRGNVFWLVALCLVGTCFTWYQWPNIYADPDGHAVQSSRIYLPQLIAILQIVLIALYIKSRTYYYRLVFYILSFTTVTLVGCDIRMTDLWRMHTFQAPQMMIYYVLAWASIVVTIGALVSLVRQSRPTIK